jgi:hypothetical protein
MRKVTIQVIQDSALGHDKKEHTYADEYSIVYVEGGHSDSEALHFLLCQVDPGDTYNVLFAPTDEEWATMPGTYDFERREV